VPEAAEARRTPWVVAPRLHRGEEDGERHATWLELFFDLVFVVAITELSHVLVADHSLAGFLRFTGLFIPVWVAWQGYSFYADRFDTDDLVQRIVFFWAMLAVSALAVLTLDVAHGQHSAGFAIAYVLLRSPLVLLYALAWRSVEEARPLTRHYGVGYALGVAIWIVSIFVPAPARYVVWGVAMAVELTRPPRSMHIHRRVPVSRGHAPERWALFTMIAIGESVAAIALETAGTRWKVESAAAAILGFLVVAGVWWISFDRQDSVQLPGAPRAAIIYSYAHLPLLLGLAAMSAGLRLLIDHAEQDSLGLGATVALVGGVVAFLLALVAARVVTVRGPHRQGVELKLGAAAALLVLIAVQGLLPPVVLVALLATVLGVVIVVEHGLPRGVTG
jgi:low temperature requirement protein LtrA